MSRGRARKSADSVRVGDRIYVYGLPIEVVRVRQENRHPFQFVALNFSEFQDTIRVSSGWQLDWLPKESSDEK